MSEKDFIKLLQNLLTMVDKKNPDSITYAKNVLENLVNLTSISDKKDRFTFRVMVSALEHFDMLVDMKSRFEGRPGEYADNEQKRSRLLMMLAPGC